MKIKKHGHYYDHIQFIGREVKVEIIKINHFKNIDGYRGSEWVGQIDDKQLIKRHNFEVISAPTYHECKMLLMDWLLTKGVDELDAVLKKAFGTTCAVLMSVAPSGGKNDQKK